MAQEVQEVQNEMLEELVSKRKVAKTSSRTCESQLLGMTTRSRASNCRGELRSRLCGLGCLGCRVQGAYSFPSNKSGQTRKQGKGLNVRDNNFFVLGLDD